MAVDSTHRTESAVHDDSHSYRFSDIEPRWRKAWADAAIYGADDDAPGQKWFSLTMYPYPSGVLHVGHWYAFAIPDVFARLQRMRGYNVLFPMGFDAFGLPAENAAIRSNSHPAAYTFDNMPNMRRQYDLMGAMIDWSRQVTTCEPEYYRWNQWFFLQMLEQGLAYRANGSVWWCPNDQTVLANEQVLEGNVCERCGASVYKRDLEQWYFRITDYAQELLDEIDGLDWPERVKTMQRNWIGRSEGARLGFPIEGHDETLEVFTTRPDTVFGATFMVIAPEHPLVAAITAAEQRPAVEEYRSWARTQSDIERQSTAESHQKTGVFTGAFAVNPLTDERIPIWVADYVLMTYGTGAIMAVPAHDERDFEFARAFDLPMRVVIQPEGSEPIDPATMTESFHGTGVIVNSGEFDGMRVPEQLPEIVANLDAQGRGKAEVTFRLRDWLISRQRYWGTPIPVVYCQTCGVVPVPESRPSGGVATRRRIHPYRAKPARAQRSVPECAVSDMRPTGTARDRYDGHLRRLFMVLVPLHGSSKRHRNRSIPRRPRSGRRSISTAAASNTRSCTCSTRGSSRRCCGTWGWWNSASRLPAFATRA